MPLRRTGGRGLGESLPLVWPLINFSAHREARKIKVHAESFAFFRQFRCLKAHFGLWKCCHPHLKRHGQLKTSQTRPTKCLPRHRQTYSAERSHCKRPSDPLDCAASDARISRLSFPIFVSSELRPRPRRGKIRAAPLGVVREPSLIAFLTGRSGVDLS